MKYFIAAAAILVIGLVLYFIMMFTGPHMVVQQHIRSYQLRMPLPPDGTVTVEQDRFAVPDEREAAGMKNPVSDSQASRERGKIYYSYYCVFCHGENGQGDGPVGYSYMPAPTDLHDPKVLKESDGGLMRKMLTGTGHEPVLARVVPPEHRWHLVNYLRALGKTPLQPAENQGRQVVGKEPGITK